MRRAKCTSHGMIDENRARRNDPAHDIEGGANNQRRNASLFDDVSDKTDGLMTKWSIRHQEGQVDTEALQFIGDSRRELCFDLLMVSQPTHERDVKRRNCADCSPFP